MITFDKLPHLLVAAVAALFLAASCAGTLEDGGLPLVEQSNTVNDELPFQGPTVPITPGGSNAVVPGDGGHEVTIGLGGIDEQVDDDCTGPADNDAIICVDASSNGDELGTADDPFTTIGAALSAAGDGDEVRVAAGSYAENVLIKNKALKLLGGFAGGGDFYTRAPADHVSTIDGQGGDAAVVLLDAGASEVSGFRVINGTGSERASNIWYLGGGLYIAGGSPLISNNLIEQNDNVSSHADNDLENQGGGIYAERSTVTIARNVIRDNRTGRGAVATSGGEVHITQNLIEGNVSIGDHGGGLYLSGPSIEVVGNQIARNRIEPKQGNGGWGGGIMVFDKGTQATLSGNVITDNFAPAGGSGAFVDDGANVTLSNELIVNNLCPQEGAGAGLFVDGLSRTALSRATVVNCTIAAHDCGAPALFVERSEVVVSNTILWHNGGGDLQADQWSSLELTYSISAEPVDGEGNQSIDPRFADPPSGDFHLRSTTGRFDQTTNSWVTDAEHSPAIDAADPSSDTADEPSPNGSRRNLGAYGGTPQASRS